MEAPGWGGGGGSNRALACSHPGEWAGVGHYQEGWALGSNRRAPESQALNVTWTLTTFSPLVQGLEDGGQHQWGQGHTLLPSLDVWAWAWASC